MIGRIMHFALLTKQKGDDPELRSASRTARKSQFYSTAKRRSNEGLYASSVTAGSAGMAEPQDIPTGDRASSYVSCFSYLIYF